MSVTFQFAFDHKLFTFPAKQANVMQILRGLKSLKSSQDETHGKLYRAVNEGYEKTMLQKVAGSLKNHGKPGLFAVIEMLILPDPSGRTTYVIAGLLNGTGYAARVQMKGMGLQPIRVTEVNDADFMRRVWSQSPQTVNAPMFDDPNDSSPLLPQTDFVQVDSRGYAKSRLPSTQQPSSTTEIYMA